MTSIEKLYQEAYDNEIHIVDASYSNTKKAAACIRDEIKVLVIDKKSIHTSAEKRVILAEELMHFETGLMYQLDDDCNTYAKRLERSKIESWNMRHVVRRYLPSNDIQRLIDKGIEHNYEMAEMLEVTEDFLSFAIDYYMLKDELIIAS